MDVDDGITYSVAAHSRSVDAQQVDVDDGIGRSQWKKRVTLVVYARPSFQWLVTKLASPRIQSCVDKKERVVCKWRHLEGKKTSMELTSSCIVPEL